MKKIYNKLALLFSYLEDKVIASVTATVVVMLFWLSVISNINPAILCLLLYCLVYIIVSSIMFTFNTKLKTLELIANTFLKSALKDADESDIAKYLNKIKNEVIEKIDEED